jgi:hypothetical protein
MNEIEKAIETLTIEGYYVEKPWHIEDVQQNYDCTDEEAMEVLDKTFSNEYVNQQIFDSISIIANSMNLKHKE